VGDDRGSSGRGWPESRPPQVAMDVWMKLDLLISAGGSFGGDFSTGDLGNFRTALTGATTGGDTLGARELPPLPSTLGTPDEPLTPPGPPPRFWRDGKHCFPKPTDAIPGQFRSGCA
jgi:hypothetical protein